MHKVHLATHIHYETVGGVAVDWINDKVYFSFGDTGSNSVNPNHLGVYDITNGTYNEIILTPTSVFRDLTVDPIAGYVAIELCCSFSRNCYYHPFQISSSR